MSERASRSVLALIALALTAAAARLIPLTWLHPLNYDEIEFFRATEWVRHGLVPYRDFWQNHTPLQWYLFAPFTALSSGDGVAPVIFLRWMQVPLWVGTFWVINRWMRDLELPPVARWAAMALALSSSWVMLPAVEFRLDAVGAAFYLAGLMLAFRDRGRGWNLGAGFALFLAGAANFRLGPLLAVTLILLSVIDVRARVWRARRDVLWIFGGGFAAAIVFAIGFGTAGAIDELVHQVWTQNYLGDQLIAEQPRQFVARLLVPFGLLLRGTQPTFAIEGVDPGGIALLVLGAIGLVRGLRNWRTPDAWFITAVLQLVNLAFIARMKVVYNYHFMTVALMLIPFVAGELSRIRRREVIWVTVIAAWCVNLFASVLRGKELDRAYQDLIIREVHRRTLPSEVVFYGAPFALRREPAYRMWILADLSKELVEHGHERPYSGAEVMRNPPAAFVADYYALRYLGLDRGFRRFVVTHYVPVWRNLWVAAPNGRVEAGKAASWIVLRDGDYRLYASAGLAEHPWFAKPVFVGVLDRPDAARFPVRVGAPVVPPGLEIAVDGASVDLSVGRIRLKKGQKLTAAWGGEGAIGVLFLPGDDELWFRQPPPRVTLEAAYPRVTHWPRIGANLLPE